MKGRTPREDRILTALAVVLAVAFPSVPWLADTHNFVVLLAEKLLHPELGRNLYVLAGWNSLHSLGDRILAYPMAGALWAGVPAWCGMAVLNLAAWSLAAWLFYRLILTVTRDRDAAFLGTVFFGAALRLVAADIPAGLGGIGRMTGLIPLLLGMHALVLRKRWRALGWIALATYTHPNPAVFFWPVLFLEDALEAWRDPRERRSFLLRAGAALAAAVPALLIVGGMSLRAQEPEVLRMLKGLFEGWVAGGGISAADRLFSFEGCVLIGMALWAARRSPEAPLWLRVCAVCAVFLLLGRLAFHLVETRSAFWDFVFKLHPNASWALPELVGSLLLPLWIVRLRGKDPLLWLPFLLAHAVSSVPRDFVMRMVLVAAAFLLTADRRRTARALLLGAAALPFVHWALPGLFPGILRSVGAGGGMLLLPVFQVWHGALLSAAFAAAALLRTWETPSWARGRELALAVLVLLPPALWIPLQGRIRPERPWIPMARWVNAHTERDSLIALSPIDILNQGVGFMVESERALFCTRPELLYVMHAGPLAPRMIGRLRAMGVDFGRIEDDSTLKPELYRADRALTGEMADSWVSDYGVRYLIRRSPPPFPAEKVRQEGGYILYRLRQRPLSRSS